MDKTRKNALLCLIAASLLWSTGGVFIKLVTWNPVAIAGARSGIAALIMLLYLGKPVRHLDRKKVLGALTYASMLFLFVTANKLTTAANTILLQFTAPVWVLLFSRYFLKEKIKKYDVLTIIIVMFGMVLFFVGGLKSGNLLGNLIAVLSGVAFAGVVIFLKLQKDSSPVEMTFLGNLIAFLIAIPFFPHEIPSTGNVTGLLILGVFQLGISYILYSNGIKHVTSVEAILIPVLEPLLNPVWVALFTGEMPGIYAFIGGAIVLTAIIVHELYAQNIIGHNIKRGFDEA